MNLLGIDVGTTGCKAALFSAQGEMLASAYREYDVQSPQPGWAELDAAAVWQDIQSTIRSVMAVRPGTAVHALSVSSLGEAVVPVSDGRQILGPSLLNFDRRGAAFLPELAAQLTDERLYALNGNTLGNHYTLTKLKWIQAHQPDLYARAHKFLHWGAFVPFMLGADPALDYSLANRTLLFDLDRADWSAELLAVAALDREKLPALCPSGTAVGTVSPSIAAQLGLPPGVLIVAGSHDQCANAVGCGVLDAGSAVYGMGTYHCITPVFTSRLDERAMIARGLNTEHHAIPGRYVSFIYNQGGALVKWYRDTFAVAEHRQAQAAGRSVYPELFAELTPGPGTLLVLPHFAPTGPPSFISDSSGVIVGLRLGTQRAEVLQGIIEGITYYLQEVVDSLPALGITIEQYRAAGGGSRSDRWVQTCSDILDRPFVRPQITEAGTLGAAIIAGVGAAVFDSFAQGAAAMVRLERAFEPDPARHGRYRDRYEQYRRLWPLMAGYLRELTALSSP